MCTNERFSRAQTNHEPNTLSSGKLCIFSRFWSSSYSFSKCVLTRHESWPSLSLYCLFIFGWLLFFLKSSGLTFLCFLGVVSSTPSFSTSFSLLLRSLVHSSHVMYVAPSKCCTQIYGVLRGCCFGIHLLLNACTDVGSMHLRKTTQTRINLLASGVSLQDGSGIPPIGAEWPWSLRHYALSHMTSLRNKRIEPGCQAWWEEPFPTPTGPQALWATGRALTGFPAPSGPRGFTDPVGLIRGLGVSGFMEWEYKRTWYLNGMRRFKSHSSLDRTEIQMSSRENTVHSCRCALSFPT